MSRLDDELREAFRRETPSADFTERVLKAVAAAPAPKRSWWDELLSLLATPKVRLVAVGVAVSLLIVLWAVQSQRLRGFGPDKKDSWAQAEKQVSPAPDNNETAPKEVAQDGTEKDVVVPQHPRHRAIKPKGQASERQEVAKSEGEIAKERLMLALHIASASLNEAQRMVKAGD
jgi:hypothetical protein